MTDLSEIKTAFNQKAQAVSRALLSNTLTSTNGRTRQKELRAENAELLAQIEDMETNGTKPGLTHEKGETAMHREHMKRFDAWLRHPHDGAARESLGDFETHERKALSDGVHASGGYAVPEIIGREIERLEKKFSPVRNLVKVVQAGSPSYKELVNIRGTTAGWVGESGSRSETQTSEFCEVSPTHGELYAYPQASEWVVADAFFNVGQWLS